MDLVTVIVPARNEEAAIGACLDSILAQDVADLQVVVVDGGSRDRTRAIVEAIDDPRIEIVSNPGGRIPVSLNLGLAAARGRWLVRVDAHSTVGTDHVRILTEHLATGDWGGAGGRKDAVARTRTGAAIALALGSPAGVGDSAYHWATEAQVTDHVPFGAYPVALLRELGGWDERLEANEDYEMDLRIREAGYELLLDPTVRIEWRSKETLGALFSQYRRYGRGKADVTRVHPGTLGMRHLVPPSLILGVGTAAIIGLVRPALGAILVVPYAAFVAIAAALIAARAGRLALAPRVAAALVTMHVAWGIGFWEGRLGASRRLTTSVVA